MYTTEKGKLDDLSFFPSIYQDEDLRSVIKRYHIRSGNLNELESRKDLFNTVTNTVLPRNIEYLFNRIPYTFDKNNIIFKHTFLPLIYPFVDSQKKEYLLEDINYIKRSTNSAGAYLNDYVSKYLRYCPDCKALDVQKYGEYYARRIHQIKGFNFCIIHDKCLEDEFGQLEENVLKLQEIPILKPILNDIDYILNSEILIKDSSQITYRYIAALLDKGYLTKAGKLKTNLYIDEINNKYFNELRLLGLDTNYIKCKNRVWKMVKMKHRTPNPILHILMIKTLKESIDKFINENPSPILSNLPFGCGPWSCHNHLCAHSGKRVIRQCIRKFRKGSYPTATFICPYCGFTYVKNTSQQIDQFQTVEFGHIWENELISKYKESLSLKETAIHCGVKNTVARKYLLELSSEYRVKNSKGRYTKYQIEEMINTFVRTKSIRKTSQLLGIDRKTLKKYIPEENIVNTNYNYNDKNERNSIYKNKVIECISSLNSPTRTEIKALVGSEIYKTLMKEERLWMEEILPSKNINQRDWQQLDIKICQEIIKIVKKLKEDIPRYRITKNRIKESITPSHKFLLQNNSNKLINSIDTLNKQIESMEEYQIRKLDYTINLLGNNYEKVTLAVIKSQPAYREMSPTLEKMIEEKLNN